jgi:glycosyltransferase involved in cell wall biosynthesis
MDIYAKNVDIVIVPSLFYQKKLIEWGFESQKVTYIPNFIDENNYIPEFIPGKKFVYFGRLSKEKGLYTLLRATKEAGADLVIAGEGPEKKNLEAFARQINAQVEFTGFLSGNHLKDVIKSSRAVILPSEWYENAPISIMESFALGKPVIGARIGGLSELIQDGERGITFTSGSIPELAEAMRSFIRMKDPTINAMGRNARVFIESYFNRNLYYHRINDLYCQLIKNR